MKTEGILRRNILFLLVTGLLSGFSCLAAETPRAALLDFERAGAAGSLEPELTDFSRAVQSKLLSDTGYVWIERQEFERLTQELTFQQRNSNSAAAVRLGRLLRADLVLRGEIETRGDRAELMLQVIDLKRADLLAARTVPVTIDKGMRLRPTLAEIDGAAAAARAVLDEGRTALARTAGLRVIAPLYFKNVSHTGRLNFVEERLAAAVEQAAGPANGFHLLAFPQTTAAREESELVLGGLTDTNPDAWQQVADAYVWAAVEEKGGASDIFENVSVTITLWVWDGFSAPVETKWEGPVRELDRAVEGIVMAGLRGLKAASSGAVRENAERDRVAADMFNRAKEMSARLRSSQFQQGSVSRGVSGEDYARSAEGQRIKAYLLRLLDIAVFLKPLDATITESAKWMKASLGVSQTDGRVSSTSLSGAWQRVRGLQTRWNASQGRGGLPDAVVAKELIEAIRVLHQSVGNIPATWYHQGPELTALERRDQGVQVAELWLNNLISVNQAFAGRSPPPWLEEMNRRQISLLQDNVRKLDIVRARALLERSWPVLKIAAGQVLRTKPENTLMGDPREDLVGMVFSVGYAFGNNDHAIVMLDDAWKSSGPVESEPAVPTNYRSAVAVPAGWSRQERTEGPALRAAIQEIEPWSRVFLHADPRAASAPLAKDRARVVDAMAWHHGRLWIAETAGLYLSGRLILPPELLNSNPEGNHFLWSYDPAIRYAEYATAQLKSHTTIRSMLSQGENLWLGFDGAGLWRWNPDNGQIRRFKGEDGLITLRIRQAQFRPDALAFLGGEQQKPMLMQYDLATGNWTGLDSLPAGSAATTESGMAWYGRWLGYANGESRFYNLETKQWKRMLRPRTLKPGETTTEDLRFRASAISADEHGFWLGRSGGVRFLDPDAPEKQSDIELSGYTVALAHSGPWLWVLLEDRPTPSSGNYEPEEKIAPSRLALIDKRSRACVGTLVLPAKNMRQLLVAGGRVWVCGSTILEINPELPDMPLATEPAIPLAQSLPLHHAAARGDVTAVAEAIQTKTDVNAPAPNGWTPLMSAAAGGREEIARRLLAAGAEPNRAAANGTTALQLAADRGNAVLVKILLAAGAKADPVAAPSRLAGSIPLAFPEIIASGDLQPLPAPVITDQMLAPTAAVEQVDWSRHPGTLADPALIDYRTPLIAAARQGSSELVDLLLDYGAKPDQPDRCGRTALLLAVHDGRAAAARALLARGASPLQADAGNMTPVLAAYLRHDDEALLRDLVKAVPAGSRRVAVSQLLYLAAQAGHTEDLELLRSLGGDINARLRGGESVLSAAMGTNRPLVIDWLLRKGVKIEGASDGVFNEVIDIIMRRGDAGTLEKLLNAGLNVNAELDRKSLLIRAIIADKPALVALLKERGADLTHPSEGKLPMAWAESDKVRAILGGALPDEPGWRGPHTDNFQRGPMVSRQTRISSGQLGDPGVLQGEPEIPTADRQLLQACALSNLPLAREAVAARAHLDCRDEEGMTPLTHALEQRAPEMVRWLVDQGADVNYPTKMANFPLVFAVKGNQPDLVDFLLERGADANPDGVGISPLMAAARSRNLSLAKKLLAAGADPNLCGGGDGFWRTNPLAEALLAGDQTMVEYLLGNGANPRARFELYRRNDRVDEAKLWAPSLLMWAASGGQVELLQRMIGLGQDAKYQTSHGEDALSWAARDGRKEAVIFLLPRSEPRGRAINAALEKGHAEIVKILQSAGYQSL